MNYIESLRKHVGSAPLIMVGAATLVIDAGGRLLLLKRADNGAWGLPGGAMELGERIEEAARRETKEETGLELDSLELLGVFSGPEMFYEYPHGDQVHNVAVAYLAKLTEERIRLDPREHSAYDFFDPHSLPEPISPPELPLLKAYLSRLS